MNGMRQIAVGVVQLDRVETDTGRALGRIDERGAHPRNIFERGLARCQPCPNGIADGAMVGHGSASGFTAPPRFRGRCAEALRPACAIWMPTLAVPLRRQCASTRAIAASLSSVRTARCIHG